MTEPKTYTKRPVQIQAMRFDGSLASADAAEKWAKANDAQIIPVLDFTFEFFTLMIKTLEGDMAAQPGDYIIRGVQGEFYPCKPDIFEATYDEV